MRYWQEFGVPAFGESTVIACDASIERARGADPPAYLAMAGAAVGDCGQWWAWRAEVELRYGGRASAWAECYTTFRVLQRCRPAVLVLADHRGAISLAQTELRGADRGRQGARKDRLEAVFGPLPVVDHPGGASVEVRHYGGHPLFHRADKISRAIRGSGGLPGALKACERTAGGDDTALPKKGHPAPRCRACGSAWFDADGYGGIRCSDCDAPWCPVQRS